MPKTLDSLMYTITGTGKDRKPDDRKILVINGIPFYFSTGSSEDRQQFVGPQWRKNLWMPFTGVDTKPKKEGHISKFGENVGEEKLLELEKELKTIIKRVFKTIIERESKTMEQAEGDERLRSLLLEKYLNRNDIKNDDIFLGLAQQLGGRFGTIEMMIISMYISPGQWQKNELFNEFMKEIIKVYPQFNHYKSMDLPFLIDDATLKVTIKADIDDEEQLKKASVEINKWLKIETQKEEQFSENISESRGLVSAFLNKNDYHNPQADRIIKGIEKILFDKLTDVGKSLKASDRSSNKVVINLEKEFKRISREAITELTLDNQGSWKQTYLTKLKTAVKTSLDNEQLDKNGSVKNLGTDLLNLITLKEIEEELCAKLMDESSAFKERRGDSTPLNETDRSRNKIVEDLEKEFRKISSETITELTRDNQDSWKQTYQTKLTKAVTDCLANKQLDKYGSLEKLGIALLNLITLIVFPVALIKKEVTGNYFFSTVGKSKEAVEETGQIVKNKLSSNHKEKLQAIKGESEPDDKNKNALTSNLKERFQLTRDASSPDNQDTKKVDNNPSPKP